VVEGPRSLTYAELDTWSSEIAARLGEAGVGTESVVGLCMPRSLEMVATMLGVLRAGACCMAMDPSYPPERLAFMAEDAAAHVVVTVATLQGRLPESVHSLTLEAPPQPDGLGPRSAAAPARAVHPASGAYLIYTSGTTGR